MKHRRRVNCPECRAEVNARALWVDSYAGQSALRVYNHGGSRQLRRCPGSGRLLAPVAELVPYWRRDRVDGVTAVSWRNSVFTRHRTDLPFPAPATSAS